MRQMFTRNYKYNSTAAEFLLEFNCGFSNPQGTKRCIACGSEQ